MQKIQMNDTPDNKDKSLEVPAQIRQELTVPAGRLGKKDRLALILSTLSFLVSISTLALNRWDNYREDKVARLRDSYSAFQLGDRFATIFIVFHQVNIGSKEEIANARRDALAAARTTQGDADKLDLRFSLSAFVEEYKPGQNIISIPVTKTIENRLFAERGKYVADHFSLGFWLTWYALNIGISTKDGKTEQISVMREKYPQYKAMVNDLLSSAGILESLPDIMPAPQALFDRLQDIQGKINKSLRANAP